MLISYPVALKLKQCKEQAERFIQKYEALYAGRPMDEVERLTEDEINIFNELRELASEISEADDLYLSDPDEEDELADDVDQDEDDIPLSDSDFASVHVLEHPDYVPDCPGCDRVKHLSSDCSCEHGEPCPHATR